MAEHTQSSRDIERDIETERTELRGTLEEITDRLTFDEIWNRVGGYMRGNSTDIGESFARIAREKPVALGLTALGIGLLVFGPSQSSVRGTGNGGHEPWPGDHPEDSDLHEETRARLAEAEFKDRSASGPTGRDARSDPWSAPHHGTGTGHGTPGRDGMSQNTKASDTVSGTNPLGESAGPQARPDRPSTTAPASGTTTGPAPGRVSSPGSATSSDVRPGTTKKTP